MSDSDHPLKHDAEAAMAAGDAPVGDGGELERFDITAALLHHNLPYPAWEVQHGHPWLVFDLGTYAAINLEHLRHERGFAAADASTYAEWAEHVVVTPDFRFQLGAGDARDLAKAMALVDAEHVVFPRALSWVNQQLFFGFVAFALLFLVVGVFFRRRIADLMPRGRVQGALEGLVVYLRDEVVKPNFHHGANAWTPFFVSMFLMILAANLLGLVPTTGTLTGNIGVTAGFASVTLFCMLFFGLKEQGPKFFVNLVPVHFTLAMSPIWVLLFFIELMGLAIRPFALAVRLFANMFAGHTVLLVFLSLAYVIIGQSKDSVGLAAGLGATGFVFATAFHGMELLVAFVQAYVFTMLSAMFIGMSIHPEH